MESKILVNVNVLAMGKSFYFETSDKDYKENDLIVVETSRGIELGKVVASPIEKEVISTDEYPKVIKKGTQDDLDIYNLNLERSKDAIQLTQQEADKLELNMKIVSADYTLDSTKVLICFLSEDRVDFRELLKSLATELKCRIELRQIGTRDKAKMIGGIGICGLKLCCSSFLNEFDGISITMAKNQMLALNIPKLSGHCGKLICCLKFENDVYTELKNDLPRVGTRVRYENDIYKITSMNVITKMIRIENKDNIATVPYDTIKDALLPRDYPMNQPTPPQVKEEPVVEEVKEEANNAPKENSNFNSNKNFHNNQNRNNGQNGGQNRPYNNQNRNNNGNPNNGNNHNHHFNKNKFHNRNGNQTNNNQNNQQGKNNDAKN